VKREGRVLSGPDVPIDPLVKFTQCFHNVTRDEDVVSIIRALVSDPGSGTPNEAALLEVLQIRLEPPEWAGLVNLVIRSRHGVDVTTVAGERDRLEAQRKRAEAARLLETQRLAAEEAARVRAAEEAARVRAAEEAARVRAAEEAARVRAAEEAARVRAHALERLVEALDEDFTNAAGLFEDHLSEVLTHADFLECRAKYVQRWVMEHAGRRLDLDQAAAVGSTGHNVLLTARAGSGKTAVLVNRALFLMKHCGISADTIVLLAFNRRAAQEIEDRLKEALSVEPTTSQQGPIQVSLPHVSTFHSLAYAVAGGGEQLIRDDPDDPLPQHSGVLQEVLDALCADKAFLERVRAVMLEYFRRDLDLAAADRLGMSTPERLEERRGLPQMTLAGEHVKSFGEKAIANFLFERGIPYSYERAMTWNGRPYRPDFTVDRSEGSVVIEYFGMKDAEYRRDREAKKTWLASRRIPLVEVEPRDVADRTVLEIDQVLSPRLAPHMTLPPRLSEDEIWERCRDLSILEISRALRGFVSRCRQQWITPDDLERMTPRIGNEHPELAGYLRIAVDVYRAYLDHLAATGMDDFAGLMQRAVAVIESGKTVFVRRQRGGDLMLLRHVLVDEFQDFSELFHRLLSAIRSVQPEVDVFAVGDDWQAINGFAGSDLRFFNHFDSYLGPAERLHMTRNYRSRPAIVMVANELMAGRGAPAQAVRDPGPLVRYLDLDKLEPTPWELEAVSSNLETIGALRLAHSALRQHQRVHLLSRTNPERLENALDAAISKESRGRVTASTVHKYKGRECECVVLVDAFSRRFPLIHPHWVFNQVFNTTLPQIEDEERRLLYVALSRGVESLFVVTARSAPSPFLKVASYQWMRLGWDGVPPLTQPVGHETTLVTLTGSGTFEIRELLKAARFRWNAHTKVWYRAGGSGALSVGELRTEIWAGRATNVEVSITERGVTRSFSVRDGSWSPAVE